MHMIVHAYSMYLAYALLAASEYYSIGRVKVSSAQAVLYCATS